LLEHCIREDLNKRALRRLAVINPVKLVIDNFPEDKVEELEAVNNPEDSNAGTRKIQFSKTLYIEQEDFLENPTAKFFRMTPGGEVRLKYAYIVKCTGLVKDKSGEIKEIHCDYLPETRSGMPDSSRKVKGTIHWVSAKHALSAEARLYEQLFVKENPEDIEEGKDFKENMNLNSLQINTCFIEPSLKEAKAGEKYQFERLGYFCVDKDSTNDKIIFNRTVTLKDSWAKKQ